MFMDTTEFRDPGKIRAQSAEKEKVQYLDKLAFQDEIFFPLLKNLNKSNIQSHLETFTSFQTKFCKSTHTEKRPLSGC